MTGGEAKSKGHGKRAKGIMRFLERPETFRWAVGLCLGLGLGLGALAWVIQSREKGLLERQTAVAGEVAALAEVLRKEAALPFRPTPSYLQHLAEAARTQRELGWLSTAEGNPDADRQNFLEGELADALRGYAAERPSVRQEAALEGLRRAFQRALRELARVQQASGLSGPIWAAELAQAWASAGLPPEVLTDFEARLARVKEATQDLEDALGLAFLDAQQLRAPGVEVVSFRPDPKRITVNGGGWEATGFGQDGPLPSRGVAFSVEGTALVHRLLNVGTWKGLARVARPPAGPFRYTVDTALQSLFEQGPRRAEQVLAAARALEGAWRAFNPLARELTFTKAERKAFDDIMVQLEPDLKAGTPDGKPDLDLWPTEGEIAVVKEYFGEKDDLVLLRFPLQGGIRLQVLAKAGFVYTNAGALGDGQLVVLPNGTLLKLGEVSVPAPGGPQSFSVIQQLERPRATRMP